MKPGEFKETCKYGHQRERNSKGKGFCRICRTHRRRRWRHKKYDGKAVPSGLTPKQFQKIREWATRRERYGPSGVRPEVVERLRQTIKSVSSHSRHQQSQKCKRGHSWTKRNTYWHNGNRHCRLCARIRAGSRPAWAEINGVSISIAAHDKVYKKRYIELRRWMVLSHPDRGGTSQQFISAHEKLDLFMKTEIEWYKLFNLEPPQRLEWNKMARQLEIDIRRWASYPIRKLKTAKRICKICGKRIQKGHRYRDGGPTRKAHLRCVKAL